MAFIKTGDEMPIQSIYKADGEQQTCDKCGKTLVIVAMDNEDNKLVCECDAEND